MRTRTALTSVVARCGQQRIRPQDLPALELGVGPLTGSALAGVSGVDLALGGGTAADAGWCRDPGVGAVAGRRTRTRGSRCRRSRVRPRRAGRRSGRARGRRPCRDGRPAARRMPRSPGRCAPSADSNDRSEAGTSARFSTSQVVAVSDPERTTPPPWPSSCSSAVHRPGSVLGSGRTVPVTPRDRSAWENASLTSRCTATPRRPRTLAIVNDPRWGAARSAAGALREGTSSSIGGHWTA
jgi:hypothetical protein